MIPTLTNLQFFVLRELTTKEISGRELRENLAKNGVNHNRAAFYQLMSRLEDAEFVNGRNEAKQIGNQTVIERRYSLTKVGAKSVQESVEFYANVTELPALSPETIEKLRAKVWKGVNLLGEKDGFKGKSR